MAIDVNKAIFRIKNMGQEFAIVVKYGEKKFIATTGSLALVKPKFIAIVNNRKLLQPVIERALNNEQAISQTT